MKAILASRLGFRMLLAAVVVAGVVGFGVSPGWSQPDDPGHGDRSGEAQHQEIIRRIQRRLKELDERLIALARQVIQEKDPVRDLQDQLINARIEEQKAQANSLNAKLAREVAEIGVKEYMEGILPQEMLTVDGEIRIAKNEQQRAEDLVELAKAKYARTKDQHDRINLISFTLELEKSRISLEEAETKKKVLLEYTKEKRAKELKSEVRKAHADELARQATWELLKAKVEKLEKAAATPWPRSAIGKRLLTLLDRALPMQDQAHARLDAFRNAKENDAAFSAEIQDLTNQLEALIEDAEAARAAATFDGLQSQLKQATRR